MKKVIIINGRGSSGKDTMIESLAGKIKFVNVSSIDPIKKIAKRFGWNGSKDARSRRFLADLKRAFTAYDDTPTYYLASKYRKFKKSNKQVMFMHIREASEIEKMKTIVDLDCVTLLIEREGMRDWGNPSDDEVGNYKYDYVFNNTEKIEESKEKFIELIEKILKESS